MPDISLIPVPFFQGLEPYHHTLDNLPLEALATRDELINDAVDINTGILTDAIGTVGTLANRLNQSINPDGSLITTSVDNTLHNIAMHTDGSTTLNNTDLTTLSNLGYTLTNPVPFVRMLDAERDKLSLIADNATSLQLEVITSTPSTIIFDNQTVTFAGSSSLTWEFISPSTIVGNFALPLNLFHTHNYDLVPVSANIVTPDYINYKTTSISTAYTQDSLRVYINGIKLTKNSSVMVPSYTGGSPFTATNYTENYAAGTFALSRAITSNDKISIDFDITYP